MGNSTSHVLHLEIRVDGDPADPMELLIFPPGTRFDYADPHEKGLRYYVYVPPLEIQRRFLLLGEENPWGSDER
jgi:hypothetical protein